MLDGHKSDDQKESKKMERGRERERGSKHKLLWISH